MTTDITTVDITTLINFTPAKIDFSNTSLIAGAKDFTAKYTNLVVTEEIAPEIKKEVAGLNKLIKQLEDGRKEVKNRYNTPLLEFEKQVKEVTVIIDSTVTHLTKQLSIFEQERKDKKRQQVQNLITAMTTEYGLRAKYSAQVTFHDKFLNSTETMPKIRGALEMQFNALADAQTNEDKAIELQKQLDAEKQRQLEERIARRHELIAHYNAKHNLTITYDEVKHLSDVQLSDRVAEILAIRAKAEAYVESAATQPEYKIDIVASTDAPTLLNAVVTEQPRTKAKALKITGLSDADFKEIMDTIEETYPNAKVELTHE